MATRLGELNGVRHLHRAPHRLVDHPSTKLLSKLSPEIIFGDAQRAQSDAQLLREPISGRIGYSRGELRIIRIPAPPVADGGGGGGGGEPSGAPGAKRKRRSCPGVAVARP